MSQKQPKRAYYHETRDVCEGLPELLGRFPLRALLVARPGEKVILPAGPFPTELPLLNRLGFGPRPEDLVFVGVDGRVTSGNDDLEGAEIFPFSGTSSLARQFAARHGATFHAPHLTTCLRANSKAVFQDVVNMLAERHGPVGPRGVVAPRDRAVAHARELASRAGRAIAKGPHSASGQQQVVVTKGETPDFADLPGTVVVQEWVEHDCSPSLQCRIDEDGVVHELLATEQILDGTHHIGNRFPPRLSTQVRADMSRIGRLIGEAFASIGYWGICGVDFLVTDDGSTVLANEVNARIPAPWYAWNASRRLLGDALPFRMKSIRLRPGTSIGDVERAVRPLLFDRVARAGFVPFCVVPEHGFAYGVTYAPDQARLDTIVAGVDARLAELAP